MTTALPGRSSGRLIRSWIALIAALAVVASPLLAVNPVQAAPAGYVGTGEYDTSWDEPGGNRILPLMTEGKAYNGTLTGPQFGGEEQVPYSWTVLYGDLPPGITLTSPEPEELTPSATFSGSPTASGPFSFTLRADNSELTFYLYFEGTVEPGESPSTTTLQIAEVLPYSSLVLGATVTGNVESGIPTGDVEFWADGAKIATAALEGGVASANVTFSIADAGTATITAKYLGDDDKYAPSESDPATVRVYIPSASGVVFQNGQPVPGATVQLVSGVSVIDSDTSDGDGAFELDPGSISSVTDAEKLYLIRVTYPDAAVLYYHASDPNVTDVDSAGETGPLTWRSELAVLRSIPPVWTDVTLATPRQGSEYSDFVVAASPTPVTYSVSAGSLPTGLILDGTTGEISGTPTCEECSYDFTVTADNDYGQVTHQFADTVLPVGIPPAWTDQELPELRASVEVDDGVTAVGDPAIVYSVSGGVLPAGLSLSAVTGAITGVPASTGSYEFEITASNEFGSVTASFSGTVAGAAPSWTDQALPAFHVDMPVDDGVKASGDGVITYRVSAGELPTGLSLNSTTGAVIGTPMSAGSFSFEITATNEFGSVIATFAGAVAAVPEIDLTLEFKAGAALSDASSIISADGLKVGSEYTLTMYSTPVVLYTGVVGPTGGFTWTVALPADTPVGAHRLVLRGIAPDGSAMAAEAWFTLLANGTIGAISYTGPLTLPVTGVEAAPAIAAGASLLGIGAALIVLGARRRQPA